MEVGALRAPSSFTRALQLIRGVRLTMTCASGIRGKGGAVSAQQATNMDKRGDEEAAQRIQERIGKILREDWDPIGVSDAPEAEDEYDGYVGGIYRLLVSGVVPEAMAAHLVRIESEEMGLTPVDARDRLAVAAKLCAINAALAKE